MAYYRQTYMPGFTTNDTYGNFYDGKKASLITVPERLKNYDLDVRSSHSNTAGAEYGSFLSQQQAMQLQRLQMEHEQRQPQWPLKPYSGAYSQQEPLEALERQRVPVPPPLPDPEPLASSREPPPPVSVERYRNPAAPSLTGRDVQQQQQQRQHHMRSRSPPPPPDLGTYRTNMEVYTGRDGPMASQRSRSPPPASPPKRVQYAQPPPSPPPAPQPAGEPQLPVLRYGAKEIHLPDIEAVELHMRDKSKIILNVKEFYNRYLRD